MVEPEPEPCPASKQSVGIDFGLKSLAVLSIGEPLGNPRHLCRQRRRLSRKCKAPNHWHAQRGRVARQDACVTDTHQDALHQLTRRLVDETRYCASSP